VHGNKPPGLLSVARLDDKVGDRLSGRVDDQAAHLAAVTIRAACPGPDRELRLSGHNRLPSPWWTVAAPAQHQRDAVSWIIKDRPRP